LAISPPSHRFRQLLYSAFSSRSCRLPPVFSLPLDEGGRVGVIKAENFKTLLNPRKIPIKAYLNHNALNLSRKKTFKFPKGYI